MIVNMDFSIYLILSLFVCLFCLRFIINSINIHFFFFIVLGEIKIKLSNNTINRRESYKDNRKFLQQRLLSHQQEYKK